MIVWRSSRQPTSALSTCEAEVAAAATTFQVMEGLRCLLEEWGVALDPPKLLIDNKSALVVMDQGGTWRTRYFAVRAALAEKLMEPEPRAECDRPGATGKGTVEERYGEGPPPRSRTAARRPTGAKPFGSS